MKTLRLILTFYKSFAFLSFLITFICLWLIYAGFKATKGVYFIQEYFWFKIFTLAVIVYFVNVYKKNEFYYYKNLGISKLRLWIPILISDFLFFLISVIILASILHETHPGS
jgi:lipopolysaccharide export LptBFGC system permease protein LptF